MVRHRVPALRAALALLLALPAGAQSSTGPSAADPLSGLRSAVVAAEGASSAGERELAESLYRVALLEGWLLVGALDAGGGDWAAARHAFTQATSVSVETRRPLVELAIAHLQLGEPAAAVDALRPLGARYRSDPAVRRLLAEALVAAGQPEQAVQELAELRALAPDDPELAFTLASGYLRLGRVERAEALFEELTRLRPTAQTFVLVGRTYRDFGQPQRAAASLRQALALDPSVRRAHYYLGTLALLDADGPRLDEAIAELQRELALYPGDEPTLLYLGMALVESKRYEEALPALAALDHGEAPPVEMLFYLGRCLLGLERPRDASEVLSRALALAPVEGTDVRRVQGIEYQLALALRRQRREEEAAVHFAAAERLSAELAVRSRDRMARYLGNVPEPSAAPRGLRPPGWADSLPAAERQRLRDSAAELVARSYLQLGVLELRSARYPRAVELLSSASGLAPQLPGLSRALAIALFNARRFADAIPQLAVALTGEPGDAELRRLLAVARLETADYAGAAELLAGDPLRESDPALQYAYAMALVRSGQGEEARGVFAHLMREHAGWPELHVLLGQAHAAEDDYESAVAALQRALALSPTAPEAHLTLGSIYLRQGRLADAEREMRAELAARPDHVQARYQLATVLELADQRDEAIAELRGLLTDAPAFADGRYLMGKMLLARGDAVSAAAELEAAAELAPRDANVRYQLAQAYQKLGRVEEARAQFDLYREHKRAERAESP
jgi:tetratricopeptide (TPR) repeat protein